MTPVFAVGEAGAALRVLGGRCALVSEAYIGSSWLPHDSLDALLQIVRECTADCGAFTRWQRRLKNKCEACGARPALPGTLCHVCQASGKAVLSVESWAAFIKANAHRFARFIALDEIGDAEASMRNWRRLLAVVPPELHSKLVPVWHEGDPLDHLDEYDPGARLVGLGRTAGRQASNAGRKATRIFYDAAWNRYPDGAYWLLGNNNPDLIEQYPARFFDATTWERDSAYAESHGWPWSRVSKETRQRAYAEAIETIQYRPVHPPKQTGFPWAEEHAR